MVRWPLQPLQPFQKTQLQPPVGPSVDSLCHPWFTTTNLSYRFPIFETSTTALCGTTGITILYYMLLYYIIFVFSSLYLTEYVYIYIYIHTQTRRKTWSIGFGFSSLSGTVAPGIDSGLAGLPRPHSALAACEEQPWPEIKTFIWNFFA